MEGRGEGHGGSGIVRLGNISKLKGMALGGVEGGVEGWETWCLRVGVAAREKGYVQSQQTNKQTILIYATLVWTEKYQDSFDHFKKILFGPEVDAKETMAFGQFYPKYKMTR